ncbi:MAG: hypothetical protein PHH77_00425 [Victivallaceae bacterium]|nr:hypothetical protein [Victivallaceae bacterium]
MPTNPKIKKKIRAARRIFFAAVILALAIHGLLVGLFAYTPAEKVYNNTRTAGVFFLNLGNQPPEKRRELLNWLEYHDPTLIAAPNAKYGYNQLNPQVNFRRAQPDLNYRPVIPEAPASVPEKFENLPLHQAPENEPAQGFIFHNLGRMPAAVKAAVLLSGSPPPAYPLITSGGKPLKLTLPPALVEQAEQAGVKPITVDFRWGKIKLLPRVTLITSSGNRNLDLAVMRELMLHLETVAPDCRDSRLNIQWRSEAAE